jgi:hypothetical protein
MREMLSSFFWRDRNTRWRFCGITSRALGIIDRDSWTLFPLSTWSRRTPRSERRKIPAGDQSKTAKALDLKIAEQFLQRADTIIE